MKRMLVLMVFVATAAYGEIYKWTDSRGTAHFTNRMDEIPVRYRAGAKPLNYGDEPQGGAAALKPGSQPQPPRPENNPAPQSGGVTQLQQQTPPPAHLGPEGTGQKSEDRRGKAGSRRNRSSQQREE